MDKGKKGIGILKGMTRFGYFVLVVVLVVIGAVGYWWYRVAHKTPALESSVSLGAERSSVLKQVKTPFPDISFSTPIAPPDLPAELSALILAGATEPEAFALMYTGGGTGHRIEFRMVTELIAIQQAYRTVIKGGGWTILNDIRSSRFGLIEAQSARYRIRVELTRYTTASVVSILSIVE